MMAYNSPFSPFGPTYLVGTSSVQVKSSNNNNPTSYRVRNLLPSTQYFSWVAPAPGDAVQNVTVTVPTAGVPSANTIGMLPNSVEVFGGLPANAWFEAGSAGAFEITPGEGL
jgi:hypothetical protein